MSDALSCAAPLETGAMMVGGTIAEVVNSNVGGFTQGGWVVAFAGWQE